MAEVRSPFVALVWARGDIEAWHPTLARLLELDDLVELRVATLASSLPLSDDRVVVVPMRSLGGSMRDLVAQRRLPVLAVTSPVLLPADGIGSATAILDDDARVAAVSFLSNAAGHLSFPHLDSQTPYSFEGHDETTLTRRLRSIGPELLPAPIPMTAGAATLVSVDAVLLTNGPRDDYLDLPELAVAEMGIRAARRSLRIVLDPTTYVTRLWEAEHWDGPAIDDPILGHRLRHHYPNAAWHLGEQVKNPDSPLRLALAAALSKAQGLKIIIDGSCLGPIENGTQVQTLALVEALARRDDVHSVRVGVPGPIPRYAVKVLEHPKVATVKLDGPRFPLATPRADIVHRPFQPTGRLPWFNWSKIAARSVVTIQDLIAYANGAYHFDEEAWAAYRNGIVAGASQADGLVVISHDVAADLSRERLPVAAERVYVVENGTDHLTGNEGDTMPLELGERGWAARRFLVVLGANYAHKNRDLALRTLRVLREQYADLGLVFAGVSVAEGSSRVQEAEEASGLTDVVNLPDISSAERNWLLRHAAICLYPTSAEGFGLVPFEAARFGTPTVFTSFGPLAEVLSGVPVAATSWDPEALAAACSQLLGDPQLAADQVRATLKCGDAYSWDRTAEQLVIAYRELLARPRVPRPKHAGPKPPTK